MTRNCTAFIKHGITLLIACTLLVQIAVSQTRVLTDSAFSVHEDTLVSYLQKISKRNSDSKNLALNKEFRDKLFQVLQFSGSFGYAFPQLSKRMGIITSPDEAFRLYNWNVLFNDGSYRYYCLIQKVNGLAIDIIELEDKSEIIEDPNTAILNKDNWYGALYYDILIVKEKKQNYYTLLGWDGNDLFTNKKVIEILSFDNSNNPIFGSEIFKYGKQKKSRIFFEYSNKSAMTLTYNEKLKMIVFDHLSPSRKIYEGQFQYYGPDLSYDGLEWDKNKWVLLEDIDVRNEKNKEKKKSSNLTPTQRLVNENN